MKRLTLVITFVLVTLCQGQAQENRGSAKYMLPFCQTWLKLAAERDLEVRGSILKTEQPTRLTTAGMCAGLVVGVAETLRVVELRDLSDQRLPLGADAGAGVKPGRDVGDAAAELSAACAVARAGLA